MQPSDLADRIKADALLRERRDALTRRWLVAVAAIGVSALVLAFFDKAIPNLVPASLTFGAALCALAFAAASVLLPRRMLRDAVLAEHLRAPIDLQRCAMRMGLTDAQCDVFLALPPDEQKLFTLTLVFERPYTVGLVLGTGVVGAGLAYGLSIRGMIETTPYLLGALALAGWHYPRLTGLIDRGRALLVREQEQADLREVDNLEQVKQLEARPQRPRRPQLQQQQQQKPQQKPQPQPQRGPRLAVRPRLKPKD